MRTDFGPKNEAEARKKVALVMLELLVRASRKAATDYGIDMLPFTELEAACEYLGVDTVIIERTIEDLHATIDAAEFRMP